MNWRLHSCFKKYLTNGTQFTQFENSDWPADEVTFMVPQRSILGSLSKI